jgi:MFS family permease
LSKTSELQALPNHPKRIITSTIWILSLVSLFTDMASEMLYPVMPVFLQHIGFSILLIGVLEGMAEALAGLSKIYFGKMSDSTGRRLPFVQLGYSLSAISKPMMALFVYPLWIFFARAIDRVGKGIRTGARDALLNDEASKETKATVFGFHRSMDTMGAVLGPAIAMVYLYYHPQNYRVLFFIAFIPGLLAIVATFLIKEKAKQPAPNVAKQPIRFFAFAAYWKKGPLNYKKLTAGLLLFALFNSSDVFLLLKIKESGLVDTALIAVYIFYNLVFALLAYPIGILADKIGVKKIFLLGILLFAVVYTGFAFSHQLYYFLFLFFLYGIYAAATDGISKAWISNLVPASEVATAIGTFAGFQSIAALLASSINGFLWMQYGAKAAFLVTAFFAMVVLIYLSVTKFTKQAS